MTLQTKTPQVSPVSQKRRKHAVPRVEPMLRATKKRGDLMMFHGLHYYECSYFIGWFFICIESYWLPTSRWRAALTRMLATFAFFAVVTAILYMVALNVPD